MTPAIANAPQTRRAYDHRLREHVVRCAASAVAKHVHIPRSTVSTWRRRGLRPVVTTEPIGRDLQRRSIPALAHYLAHSRPRIRPLPCLAASGKELVLAPEYRHMPVGTLARYAQRIGKVFASASTWAKLVREHGWRRPRQRVHPPKPTVGVRGSEPNQIWHVDASVIKLLDGTKVDLQAAGPRMP